MLAAVRNLVAIGAIGQALLGLCDYTGDWIFVLSLFCVHCCLYKAVETFLRLYSTKRCIFVTISTSCTYNKSRGIIRVPFCNVKPDLIEYIIFGDTESTLLRCFPTNSKLKPRDIRTTVPYKNYQIFSNLKFRPLLKTSFQGILELRDMSGEKILVVSVGISPLVLRFKKVSKFQF